MQAEVILKEPPPLVPPLRGPGGSPPPRTPLFKTLSGPSTAAWGPSAVARTG